MYSHKQNGSVTEVYRDDTHVATFDPVEEEVKYTKPEHKRYSKHVARLINNLDKASPPPAKPVAVAKPAPTKATDKEKIKLLKSENDALKIENVSLKDEISKLKSSSVALGAPSRVAERFSDAFDDSKGKHLMGAYGDMTPEYVEWARKNMPKEIFDKRYHGRL